LIPEAEPEFVGEYGGQREKINRSIADRRGPMLSDLRAPLCG
jgi:hypothetical protein